MISGHQHQPLGARLRGRSQACPSVKDQRPKTVKDLSSAPLGKLEGMRDSFITQKGPLKFTLLAYVPCRKAAAFLMSLTHYLQPHAPLFSLSSPPSVLYPPLLL